MSSESSFLSYSSDLIVDMNNNPVVPTLTSNALAVTTFTNDTSGPQVVGFDLDMNLGILSIYFQETVNIHSVNYSCISILSDVVRSTSYRLTGGNLLMPYVPGELGEIGSGISGSGIANGSGSGSGSDVTDNIFVPPTSSNEQFDRFVVFTDEEASRDTTAIFINITLTDLNAIKILQIADTERSAFLQAESCTIQDQNSLPLIAIDPGLGVRFYTPDITAPQLQEFDINLNNGHLTMRFSETVSGSHFIASEITLQGEAAYSMDSAHTLGLDNYMSGIDNTPGLATEIILTINILDLNRIKELTRLATSRDNTFISITSNAVQDSTGNQVASISITNALQVSEYTEDTTRPRLIAFKLDLDSDVLSLTFDETVSGATLDETQIILQEYRFSTPGDSFYQLIGSPHDNIESTIININLSFEDRNAIKTIEDLASHDRNVWIVFSEDLINDTSMNQVVEIPNVPSLDNPDRVFEPDLTRPRLLAFSLNLTSEILSLSFSETVNTRTINIPQISLQSGPESINTSSYTLTNTSSLISGNSAFLDIQLSLQDLNDIKRLTNLATNANNTYIMFGSGLIQDMNLNAVVNVSRENPLMASSYSEDTILPRLTSFDLDMTLEFLTLSFSETVDATNLDIAGITLQGNGAVDPYDSSSSNQFYELTGGVVVIDNLFSPIVAVNLSDIDLNEIKRLFNLATEREDTFISFESSLIRDMNMNEVIASSPLNAQQVEVYTPDTIQPVLKGFSLNIDIGILLLNFSEVVNVDSFDISMIYIQAFISSDSLLSVQLLRSDISSNNDTFIEVSLSRLDLDNIKRNIHVAISNASTYIAIPNPVLRDMAQNLLVPIPQTDAINVGFFQADSQPPILEMFDVDLNRGQFTLYFDEVVNLESLNLSSITFQTLDNLTDSFNPDFESITLESGSILTTRNEATVTIKFTNDDLNTIKMRPICQSPDTCYISFPFGTISDTSFYPIDEVLDSVFNYTSDITPPQLLQFIDIDLNNGTLTLEFDETVNVDSFNFSGFVLQSFFRDPQAVFMLSGGMTNSDNGTIVTVRLLPEDLLRLKADERVCSNSNNCWLTVLGDTLTDMNGNGISPITDRSALDAGQVQEDNIRPKLLSYSLDVEEGVLAFIFDEPVRPSTLDPRGIFIQPSPNATEFVQLTTGSFTNSVNGIQVTIVLSQSDLDRIKATNFAKSENDTYLRLESFTIRDVAVLMNNFVVEIPNGEAQRVSIYTADTSPPYLVAFSLNLIPEIVTLTFNEPVRPSTLDVTEITLLSLPEDENDFMMAISVPLTSGSVIGDDAFDGTFTISITLNREAIAVLKLENGIATGTQDTFISLTDATLTDTAGNYILPIHPFNATQANEVIQDDTSTPASLDSYGLDLNLGRLLLTFTDIVNPRSFHPGSITIQDEATANISVSLSSTSITSSMSGYEVVVDIGISDLNAIKFYTSLATNINNTFVTLGADAVRDLQGSDIIPITDDNGVRVSYYIEDTTRPVLESFSLDLKGQLLLSFSETVNVSSLNVSGITLQSRPTSNLSDISSVRLTDSPAYPIGSQSLSENSAFIVIDLGSQDLNEIKRLSDLGTMLSNTFISIENGSIVDTVNIENLGIYPDQAIMTSRLLPDTIKPELLNFSLDLTQGIFHLTFSETVNASTLNVNGILVQNSSNTFLDRVPLRMDRGSRTESPDGVIITVNIGRDDLNDIKRNRMLGTSISNTYLFLEDYVIQDTSLNSNVPIYNPFAIPVSNVTPDRADPFLLSFDLDLNRRELILTFDETVDTSSLMIQEIIIQNTRDLFGGEFIDSGSGSGNESGSGSGSGGEAAIIEIIWRLNPGNPPLYSRSFSGDDPVVIVSLGEVDFNEISRLSNLATYPNNTHIAFSAITVQDMNGNLVTEIVSSYAIMVSTLTPDQLSPTLRQFDLDMDNGEISLTFSETVNALSLNASLIVFQDGTLPSVSYQLTGGMVLSDNSTVIVVRMIDVDLNYIKNYSNLLTSVDNSYIRLLQDGVRDMTQNPIAEIDEANAIRVLNFTEDRTSPILVSFDLNMSTDELTLVFDETIDTSSLKVEGILLQNQQLNSTVIGGSYAFHRLRLPSHTVDPDSTTFTVRISREDSNEIKRITSLAIDEDSTYLSIRHFTVTDTNGNNATALAEREAIPVRNYVTDLVPPMLESFHLDLDSNQLVLSFDETINISSVPQYMDITLHNGYTVNSSSRSQSLISGGEILNTDHSHIVYIRFTLEDINNIKLYPDFGTSSNNTFVTIADNTVMDLSLQPNGLIGNTLPASAVIQDEVSPRLQMFTVDLNAERLILFFNEPVNVSSLVVSGLTLQNARRSRTGVVLSTSNSPSGNGVSVVINLSNDDLNEIKRLDTLFTDQDTSFVTLTPGFIQDMSGNQVTPVLNGFAIRTAGYTEDSRQPFITSFSLDMNIGYVTLSFSETVNVSSLMCDLITFASSPECNNSYTLTGCIVDTRNVSFVSTDIGTSGSGSTDYGSAPKWMTDYHYGDKLSFWFTLFDHNQLKALDIARTISTTYLSYTNETILDQNDLSLIEADCVAMSIPIMSNEDFIPDTTSPRLLRFDLSLNEGNEGRLVLFFSETVSTATLKVRELSLLNFFSVMNASQMYQFGELGDNNTRTFDGPTDVVTVHISPADLNAIKFLDDLAVSNITSFLAATSLAVSDTNRNPLEVITPEDALAVSIFTPDVTPPILTGYILDMNLGLVHFTFDETVNIDTLRYSSITFQVVSDLSIFNTNDTNSTNTTDFSDDGSGISQYSPCEVLYYQLNGGELFTSQNSTLVSFNLTLDDLNAIKRETCLATSEENTFLSLQEDGIRDMNDNGIVIISRNDSEMVTSLVEDITRPHLLLFDLNLTSEILTLFFDETVNVSSFDPTQITFLSDIIIIESLNISDGNSSMNFTIFEYLTTEVNYTLTDGQLLNGDDPMLFLRLSQYDLNNIKALLDLSSHMNNTFLSITSLLVSDMNNNRVNAIGPQDSIRVRTFVEDKVAPSLISYDLDLNTAILTLTFDETVNVTSLYFSAFTFLSDSSNEPQESYSLNGGDLPLYSYSSSFNNPVVTIQIGYIDINEIKELAELATSDETTYLSISPGAVLDMNGNPVLASFENSIQVDLYTPDTTDPQLVAYDLDLNIGLLTLEFSETVNASSLVLSDFTLQNGSNIESFLSLYNSTVSPEDNVFLYVQFGFNFMNELKQVDDLATSMNNTYLAFPVTAVRDMNNNYIVPVSNASADRVQNYIPDTNPPDLVSYNLDMDQGILTLIFNETVRVSTINTRYITFSQAPYSGSQFGSGDSSGSRSGSGMGLPDFDFYTLTGGYIQDVNSHVVMINITLRDLNEIKRLRNLATSSNNTFIILTSGTLDDMYSNAVVPIENGMGQMVDEFTMDTTPPDVTMYHLNMNSGTLTILFSETVDVLTLQINDFITFYNTSDFDGESYTLQSSTSDSNDGPLIVIDLSQNDLNQLKFIRNLASSNETTFLFLNRTINDMVGNEVTPLYMGRNETRPADIFTSDVTNPELLRFEFDLNSGLLFLSFSEVVDDVVVQAITLQSEPNIRNTTEAFTLTDYSDIYGPSLLPTGPGYPPEFTIMLTDEDLNAIKSLLTLAVSPESTFISVTADLAEDTFGNLISEIPDANALPASFWINDSTLPRLISFNFSADSGLLSLTFDETISVSSLNVSGITLINLNSPFGTSYTLRDQPPQGDAMISEDDSTIIDLFLSNDDLNELKILTDLATSANDTYVIFETVAVIDTSDNLLNTENLPLQVFGYFPDVTPPELEDFILDLNGNILELYFSETVNVTTLNISQITLHSTQYGNETNSSYSLQIGYEYPLGTVTRSTDGPIIRLDLGQRDLNEIKRINTLATSDLSTFISITELMITDMTGISVIPIEDTDSLPLQIFIPDRTAPVLLEFEFDLDSGELLLTFNETVNIETFDQTLFTLQNIELMPIAAHSFTLGSPVGRNDPIVLFPLDFFDLNQVKLARELATNENDTYLSIAQNAVRDMNFNPVETAILMTSRFIDDTTMPNLTEYLIDINSSLLILNFNEPVDRSTLSISEIIFQSSPVEETNPDLYYHLQQSTSNSTDGLTIHVMIHNDDLNEIKRRPGLLVSAETSYISFSEQLVSDMRGNPVHSIPRRNARNVDMFVMDQTRPRILEFHLDMDASRLHLTFLETVNASSINFTSFVIQADSFVVDEQMQYRLTSGDLESYDANTTITLIILLEDLNEIKRRQIGTSRRTSWLLVDDTALSDQNDLSILPHVNGLNALQANQFTIDTTRPVLEAFQLDLNSGDLIFSFSETVRAGSLNMSSIILQNAPLSSGIINIYSISDDGTRVNPLAPDNSHIVTYRMSTFDLNEVKRRPLLATDTTNTYISVRSSTVFDMQMNFLIPIPNGGALPAFDVIPDTLEPILLNFNLDMDSANLTLTFDESVNASTLDPSGIILTSPMNIAPSYRLTGGFVIDFYGTVVTMNLNDFDFDTLKINTMLCSGIDSNDCRMTMEAGSIMDMNGNINNQSNVAPEMVIPDTTRPYLVYYDLDLTAEELRITFSEVVITSQSSPMDITILANTFEFDAQVNESKGQFLDENDPNTYNGFLRAYTLSGAVKLSGPNQAPTHPPVLVISLTDKDLNILKSLEFVATNLNNTYLLFDSMTVRDYYMNPFTAIRNSNGKQVRVFTPDLIQPELVRFSLDLDSSQLILTFTESINTSSLQISALSFQGSRNSSESDIYRVTSGSSNSFDGPVIVVMLSIGDLNEIKRQPLIAFDDNSTYLSFTSSFITDQNRNRIVEIPSSNSTSVQVGGFVPDSTRPVLTHFSLDLNTGQIHLTFDETITAATFVIEELTLTDNATTFESNLTLSGGVLLTGDSTVLSYQLNDTILNEIKLINLCTFSRNGGDCFLVFTNNTIEDRNGNPVIPREDGNAIQVDPYIPDTTAPEIVFFSVNMSLGNFTLGFSETVNVSTFDLTGLTLSQSALPSATRYTLTGGTQVTNTNGLFIDFYLNSVDLNFLRLDSELYISDSTTYISARPTTIIDTSTNSLLSTNFYIVDEFAADTVGPMVVNAKINLSTGTVVLYFNEPIRVSTFRPEEITLQSSNDSSATSYTLTGGIFDRDPSFDGPVLTFNLTNSDLLEILANENLLVSRETTYIVYTSEIIDDLAENDATVVPPLLVSEFIPDQVDPDLFSFLELNLQDRYLLLEFNEPVDLSTANASLITLIELPEEFQLGTNITLTGGTFQYQDPVMYQRRRIRLDFNPNDYRNIVLNNRIATDETATFISLPRGTVNDFAGNPLVDNERTHATQVLVLVDDLRIPELTDFDLDVDSGRIRLDFDNVMNPATLVPSSYHHSEHGLSICTHLHTYQGPYHECSRLYHHC